MKTIISYITMSTLLMFITLPIEAAVYQCKKEDGSIEFSDTPCPVDETSIEITTDRKKSKLPAEVCETAQRFAKILNRIMRTGNSSIDVVNELGGTNVVAPGVQSIINQVFSYRHNTSISSSRAGSLVMARCNNGAFGALSVEDFPEAVRPRAQYDMSPPPPRWPSVNFQHESNRQHMLQQQRYYDKQFERNQEKEQHQRQELQRYQQTRQQEKCDLYEDRLDRLRDRMRGGYSINTAERLRSEERSIRNNINKYCTN